MVPYDKLKSYRWHSWWMAFYHRVSKQLEGHRTVYRIVRGFLDNREMAHGQAIMEIYGDDKRPVKVKWDIQPEQVNPTENWETVNRPTIRRDQFTSNMWYTSK